MVFSTVSETGRSEVVKAAKWSVWEGEACGSAACALTSVSGAPEGSSKESLRGLHFTGLHAEGVEAPEEGDPGW